MKWHTANITWTNSLLERLQNGQPSLWENCPTNQSPQQWTPYLVPRDLRPQGVKTPLRAKMWRCRTTPHREQWVVKKPLMESVPSTRKTRLYSMKLKHLRPKSSVTLGTSWYVPLRIQLCLNLRPNCRFLASRTTNIS